MDKKLFVLNIVFAITDTLMCLAVVAVFGFMAWKFGKWWISLFNLVPLALFQSHTLIINADINAAEEGGEKDS